MAPRRAAEGIKLGYNCDRLEVVMFVSFTKMITETDVYLFAGISRLPDRRK